MSPEPSFTQYLREEGFIQGPNGEDKATTPTKTEKTGREYKTTTTTKTEKSNVEKETSKPQKEIIKEEVTTPASNTKSSISPLLVTLIVVVILVIIVLIVLKPF